MMARPNKDEIKGKLNKARGSAKESIGRALGDRDMENKGAEERRSDMPRRAWVRRSARSAMRSRTLESAFGNKEAARLSAGCCVVKTSAHRANSETGTGKPRF